MPELSELRTKNQELRSKNGVLTKEIQRLRRKLQLELKPKPVQGRLSRCEKALLTSMRKEVQ